MNDSNTNDMEPDASFGVLSRIENCQQTLETGRPTIVEMDSFQPTCLRVEKLPLELRGEDWQNQLGVSAISIGVGERPARRRLRRSKRRR
jgi:hypothetical protein